MNVSRILLDSLGFYLSLTLEDPKTDGLRSWFFAVV